MCELNNGYLLDSSFSSFLHLFSFELGLLRTSGKQFKRDRVRVVVGGVLCKLLT